MPEGFKRGDYCVKEFERVPGAALARENFLQRPHAACVTRHDFWCAWLFCSGASGEFHGRDVKASTAFNFDDKEIKQI